MSLEAILTAIRASGDRQVSEIEVEAQNQVGDLLAEARQEAEKAQEDAWKRAVMPAYRERARIIHRARLERLRTVGDAREATIDAALAQVRRSLAEVRNDAGYPDILRRLTQQTLTELEGSLEAIARAHLEADPRDETLVRQILRELDLELHVSYRLECWGGLVARSEDGRIVVINTLESRLERATPFLRRYLATVFEEGETLRSATSMETPAYGR